MALVKNSVKLNNGKAVFVNEMNEYEAMTLEFQRHARIAKRLLQAKYDTKCVIRKININRNGRVVKDYMGTTSNSPMINMTLVDTNFVGDVAIENHKNDTMYTVKINGTKTNYHFYPEVIQVTFPSNSGQLDMTRRGAYIKLGERVRYTAPADMEGWTFLPGASVWGPSNEKAANKFFFADTRSNETWWTKIDELTGNGYSYFLASKQPAKKILKNTSRLNLFGTTMERFGQIDLRHMNIVVADCSFNAVADITPEQAAKLLERGMDFGTNINDGKNYLLVNLLADTLNIPVEEAIKYAIQNRENYLCTKCLGQLFMEDQMAQIKENVIALYGAENVKVYGNVNGPTALIVDGDGAKLVNRKALEAGDVVIDCYGLAIAKASNSRTSGQLIAKMLEKNYDVAVERLQELMKEAFTDQVSDKLYNSKFNPKLGLTNNTAAVLGELAVNDEGFMWTTLRESATFAKSALADMKINLNSIYNHAMFDDCFVQSCGMVDHILGLKDCGKYGKLVEVFSLDTLVYFAEEIQAIENNDALTDAEKEAELDALLSAVVIKYPSAGAEEYLGVRYLTLKEWRERCAKALAKMEGKASEKQIDHMKQYMNQIPFGVTLYASFNFIKNKLAGMDVDFDATLAIFDEMKAILINEASRNILTYIDYEDESKADYSAVEAEKRADLRF